MSGVVGYPTGARGRDGRVECVLPADVTGVVDPHCVDVVDVDAVEHRGARMGAVWRYAPNLDRAHVLAPAGPRPLPTGVISPGGDRRVVHLSTGDRLDERQHTIDIHPELEVSGARMLL